MWIIIEEHEMFCVEGGEEGSSGALTTFSRAWKCVAV